MEIDGEVREKNPGVEGFQSPVLGGLMRKARESSLLSGNEASAWWSNPEAVRNRKFSERRRKPDHDCCRKGC